MLTKRSQTQRSAPRMMFDLVKRNYIVYRNAVQSSKEAITIKVRKQEAIVTRNGFMVGFRVLKHLTP